MLAHHELFAHFRPLVEDMVAKGDEAYHQFKSRRLFVVEAQGMAGNNKAGINTAGTFGRQQGAYK